MEGKFGLSITMPERVKGLGHNHNSLMHLSDDPYIVDIGGGQGQMLLQLKDVYPHLKPKDLILQELSENINQNAGVTTVAWKFKSSAPQPIIGAQIHSLTHIFHNTADLEALELMQKLAAAMKPYSRLLIHEFSKSLLIRRCMLGWYLVLRVMKGARRSGISWRGCAGRRLHLSV